MPGYAGRSNSPDNRICNISSYYPKNFINIKLTWRKDIRNIVYRSFNHLLTFPMKRINIFLAALLILPFSLGAQEIQVIDGIAYTASGKLLNGKVETYHDNGGVKEELNYVQGLKNGHFTVYASNGAVLEKGSFQDGNKHGRWQKWNEAGLRISEVRFSYGQRDGKWQIWDDEGTLRYVMFYQNGRKTGTWQEFDARGVLVREENHLASL